MNTMIGKFAMKLKKKTGSPARSPEKTGMKFVGTGRDRLELEGKRGIRRCDGGNPPANRSDIQAPPWRHKSNMQILRSDPANRSVGKIKAVALNLPLQCGGGRHTDKYPSKIVHR